MIVVDNGLQSWSGIALVAQLRQQPSMAAGGHNVEAIGGFSSTTASMLPAVPRLHSSWLGWEATGEVEETGIPNS